MPSSVTHKEHALAVYQRLSEDAKKLVSLDHFLIFAQSHDFLYYFQSLNSKTNKSIHKLGHTAHNSNTQSYIINLIRNIINLKLQDNQEAIAYLYGSICHYALDSTVHPFVFYKTGIYRQTPETKKYQGMHTLMETQLDAYIYHRNYQKDLKNIQVFKETLPLIKFQESTSNLINLTYKKTYNKDNIAYYYLKGYKQARTKLHFLCQDRTGFKKYLYQLISLIIYHNKNVLSSYSYYVPKINPTYLNQSHQKWHHPCTNETFTTSFDDLYEAAIQLALNMINAVNNVLYDRSSYQDLAQIIPNITYSSGLPINTTNYPFQYYEF